MKKINLAVIGAGSTYTPELIDGLIRRREILPLGQLRLMDIDSEKLRIVGGLCRRMLEAARSDAEVVLTQDMEQAIGGADFVIAQVRVGRLAARERDELIPQKYGLLGQETTGIGGMMKALRTVPVIRQVAETMERLAPEAWLINFSNPSGLVAQALKDDKPDRRILGLCNIPINMQAQAARILGEDPAALEYGFVGLNHLLYLHSVKKDGQECIGKVLDAPQETIMKNVPDISADAAFLKEIGALPCSYLNYFYRTEDMLKKNREAEKCRAQVCMDIEADLLVQYDAPTLCEKPEGLDKRGGALYSEAAISLVEAIFNDTGAVHTVNIRNGGAYPFMAAEDVVEVQARIGREGAVPMMLGDEIHPHIKELMMQVKQYEKLTAKAALTGDRQALYAAAAAHPLIGDSEQARACLEEMLEANKAYLPQFFKA